MIIIPGKVWKERIIINQDIFIPDYFHPVANMGQALRKCGKMTMGISN
jgi:hypothetical protein